VPTARFDCPRCGAEVVVDASLQSVACVRCATWFHAAACGQCDDTYVAIGSGTQVCPSCGARQRLDDVDRLRSFGEAAEPLFASMSRIQLPPYPPGSATILRSGGRDAGGGGLRYPWVLAAILNVAAVLTLVGGLVSEIVVWDTLAHEHAGAGRLLLAAVEVLFSTAVAAAVLAGLAYLIEHVDAVEQGVAFRGQPIADRTTVE